MQLSIDVIQQRITNTEFSCNIEAQTGAVTELPYATDYFDAVWCANVTQYLSNSETKQMLDEFYRVVKPGGLVAIKEFDATALAFGPFDQFLLWRMLEKRHAMENKRGAIKTIELYGVMQEVGFRNIRYQTFVGNRQHPLKPVEEEFLRTGMRFYAQLAENSGVPNEEVEIWRRTFGDLDSPDHLLKQKDFYFREAHGLVVGDVGN